MDLFAIEFIEDTPAGRRMALERFIRKVDAGEPPSPELLRFVAATIRDKLNEVAPRAKHRPARTRGDRFLAWFAVECDPDFASLPRTRDGRFAAVGELLHRDATSVQSDVREFKKKSRLTDFALVHLHGERYCKAKGMPWPDALPQLVAWFEAFDARPRAMRRKSG